MKRIKVLILTTSFPLRQDSISGMFVKRLVDNFSSSVEPLVIVPCDINNHLCEKLFDYKVICFKYAPRQFRVLAHRSGGIPTALQSNKLLVLLLPFFLTVMFARCYIEAKNVDLIHANWSICGVIGGLVGKIRSIPTITTIRGEDGNKSESSVIFRTLLKIAINLSTHVVGVSDSLVNKAKSMSNTVSSKFACVPNGVDRSLVKYSQHIRPYTAQELVLITVGNLTKNKNTALVVEAVHRIICQGKKVTLNIVGDGPQRTELKSLIDKYRLAKNVNLVGVLHPDRVYELISKSDIFVLSSFREGRPNVLLESMAIGTPIVASQIDGVEELIDDGYSGLLYDPYNCEQLIQCINRIGNDIKLHNFLRANALNYIIKNKLFWDESANKYVSLYKSALKQ